MAKDTDAADEYNDAETAKRRDKVLGVLLSTPSKRPTPDRRSRVQSRKKAGEAPPSAPSKSGPAS